MKLITILLLPLGVFSITEILPQIGTVQSTSVQGKLLCNGKPYEKARLKLYEIDPLKDTLMAEMLSDQNGYFKMSGNDTEWTRIDPKLNIYHNCEDEKIECWRKIQIFIPESYISDGPIPQKTFDIGTLNLNAKLPGETRDCLN
ncbi:Transthyretin-like family protein [Dictyocaulus viviparus]|uniref:Transthyretin-like family protein n=1 Tax=Dictyocaulus viviparus TaxID=29172 RepID=A0A0D8XTE4_DICVI|nr:Transthyretin-like family protein [Dictyocaulus viviparus]